MATGEADTFTAEPLMVCPKGHEVRGTNVTIRGVGPTLTVHFCGICWAKWLGATFPVAAAVPAEPT